MRFYIQEEEPFTTQPTEILVQEVLFEFITFIREDGLKRSLLMMSTFFTTSTENRKGSRKTIKEESFEQFGLIWINLTLKILVLEINQFKQLIFNETTH